MTIGYLADHPDFIPVLAPDIAEHWRNFLPDETLEKRIAKLRTHLNKDALPIAWVAYTGNEPLGTAALRVHDLEGRDDLTPWLGGVFVRSSFRGQGVASAICTVVEGKAWSMGFRVLYLFTLDQQSLYERLGWQALESIVWHGHRGEIMTKRKANRVNSALAPKRHESSGGTERAGGEIQGCVEG